MFLTCFRTYIANGSFHWKGIWFCTLPFPWGGYRVPYVLCFSSRNNVVFL
jgi:hypothetical protein